jgi:hypothetical protein
VPTEHITNLLDTFSGNLVSLSQHPFGCRVMQRILEHCTDPARYNVFMTEILKVGSSCSCITQCSAVLLVMNHVSVAVLSCLCNVQGIVLVLCWCPLHIAVWTCCGCYHMLCAACFSLQVDM